MTEQVMQVRAESGGSPRGGAGVEYAVVIPSVGRESLRRTLEGLRTQEHPPVEVVVVDDRPVLAGDLSSLQLEPLDPATLVDGPWPLRVVRSGGRGPAAARNVGWRSVRTAWVAFLDDDVLVPLDWSRGLVADLEVAHDVAGVQGRIEVPLPTDRRPTDWERSTAGLEGAAWATADMAYRRAALAAVGGLDERFPRAYREDADLALRVRRAGWRLCRGERTILHPVRPADDRVSVRVQAGAADDALMRALHGPRWRQVAEAGRGRFRWHLATVACAVTAVGAAGTAGAVALRGGRPSGPLRVAALAGLAWACLTGDFLRRRVAPGPRPGQDGWRAEWSRMAVTSVLIPFQAVRHRLTGTLQHGGLGSPARAHTWPPPLRAVLFDRDDTLVHDVPYNGDPERVRLIDGAREAVATARAAGLAVGLITNQSGVARGLLTAEQVHAVNGRLAEEVGGFDVVEHCPHDDADRCACRKPGPAMVLRAARRLGVDPAQCAVIGDIGADVGAAVAAGARAVLVPTARTRPEEVATAPVVAPDLAAALDLLLTTPDGGMR